MASYFKGKVKRKAGQRKKAFTQFMSVMASSVEVTATEYNKRVAKEMVQEAKRVIKTQQYNWQPLSTRYLARKKKQGHDERIYIRTGEFLKAISWGVTHGKIWWGIPTNVIHEDSGLPLKLLAKWLEFGTRLMPPRPIWRPILSKFIRKKKMFAKECRKSRDRK